MALAMCCNSNQAIGLNLHQLRERLDRRLLHTHTHTKTHSILGVITLLAAPPPGVFLRVIIYSCAFFPRCWNNIFLPFIRFLGLCVLTAALLSSAAEQKVKPPVPYGSNGQISASARLSTVQQKMARGC